MILHFADGTDFEVCFDFYRASQERKVVGFTLGNDRFVIPGDGIHMMVGDSFRVDPDLPPGEKFYIETILNLDMK